MSVFFFIVTVIKRSCFRYVGVSNKHNLVMSNEKRLSKRMDRLTEESLDELVACIE